MKKKKKMIIMVCIILAIIILLAGAYIIFATEQYTGVIEEIGDDSIIAKSTQKELYYDISVNQVWIQMDKDLKVGDTIYIIKQKEIAVPDLGRSILIDGEIHSMDLLKNVLLVKRIQSSETNS